MDSFEELRDAATEYLRRCGDPVMEELVERVGACTLTPSWDFFPELVDSIVSQQISTRAAASIMNRLKSLFPQNIPQPETLLALSDEELRGAGISPQKLRYLRDLATHVVDGRLNLAALPELPDDEIIRELVAVKGIGRWTAEMFLIFCLGRPDVLPVDDLGFRSAIQKSYKLETMPNKATIQELAVPWHPYATFATWYLWRSLSLPATEDGNAAPAENSGRSAFDAPMR